MYLFKLLNIYTSFFSSYKKKNTNGVKDEFKKHSINSVRIHFFKDFSHKMSLIAKNSDYSDYKRHLKEYSKTKNKSFSVLGIKTSQTYSEKD